MQIKMLILLLAFSPIANSEEWLSFGGISKHIGESHNSLNLGIGYEKIDSNGNIIGLGIYKNSNRDVSTYLAVEAILFRNINKVDYGVMASAITGYEDGVRTPIVPTATYKNIRVALIPPTEKASLAVAIQFRIKI